MSGINELDESTIIHALADIVDSALMDLGACVTGIGKKTFGNRTLASGSCDLVWEYIKSRCEEIEGARVINDRGLVYIAWERYKIRVNKARNASSMAVCRNNTKRSREWFSVVPSLQGIQQLRPLAFSWVPTDDWTRIEKASLIRQIGDIVVDRWDLTQMNAAAAESNHAVSHIDPRVQSRSAFRPKRELIVTRRASLFGDSNGGAI